MPNGLEKYMRVLFRKQTSLQSLSRCQFLSFSLDSVVENLGEIDFNYWSSQWVIRISQAKIVLLVWIYG